MFFSLRTFIQYNGALWPSILSRLLYYEKLRNEKYLTLFTWPQHYPGSVHLGTISAAPWEGTGVRR